MRSFVRSFVSNTKIQCIISVHYPGTDRKICFSILIKTNYVDFRRLSSRYHSNRFQAEKSHLSIIIFGNCLKWFEFPLEMFQLISTMFDPVFAVKFLWFFPFKWLWRMGFDEETWWQRWNNEADVFAWRCFEPNFLRIDLCGIKLVPFSVLACANEVFAATILFAWFAQYSLSEWVGNFNYFTKFNYWKTAKFQTPRNAERSSLISCFEAIDLSSCFMW